MEAAKEEGNLLKTIKPPRLEDAGLEDCALPPEAIKEAFFKAANSIRPLKITTDDVDSDVEDCVKDLGPTEGELCDSLIGVNLRPGSPSPCTTNKGGGLPDVVGDDVVGVTGTENGDESSDRLLGSEVTEIDSEGGKRACVDVLQGLQIDNKDDELDRDDEEKEDEEPILVEALI